jgi:hypothetical protein
MINLRRFWIRKDRERLLLGGVIITCTIGTFVSNYWHFQDRVMVHRTIKINAHRSKEAQQKTLNEVQFMPSKLKPGAKQYYKMDNENGPAVPRMGEDEGK